MVRSHVILMLEILMFAATPPLLLWCFHHMDYSACDIQRELFSWQMMGRNMNYHFKSSKLNANTSILCRLYTYMMELQKLNTIKICKSINQQNALLLSPISSTIRDAIPDVCVCLIYWKSSITVNHYEVHLSIGQQCVTGLPDGQAHS